MSEILHHVQADILERFMIDVFCGLGVPREDAEVCADVLITSDKRGINSHGVNRCKPIYYDRIKAGIQNPVTEFEVVRETPTTAVIDGHNGMGHAIAKRLLVAAMACVVVKQLEGSEAEAAIEFRKYLIRLSGRRMKHGVEFTAPALLAGYYVHLAMTQYLDENELTVDELKSLEKNAMTELKLV